MHFRHFGRFGLFGTSSLTFWKVLDIMPSFWAVYFRLGMLLERQLRFADAARLYSSALRRVDMVSKQSEAAFAMQRNMVDASNIVDMRTAATDTSTVVSQTANNFPPFLAAPEDLVGASVMTTRQHLLQVRLHALVCLGAARASLVALAPVVGPTYAESSFFIGQQRSNIGVQSGQEAIQAGLRGALTATELRSHVMDPGVEATEALNLTIHDHWHVNESARGVSSRVGTYPSLKFSPGGRLLDAIHNLLGLEAGGRIEHNTLASRRRHRTRNVELNSSDAQDFFNELADGVMVLDHKEDDDGGRSSIMQLIGGVDRRNGEQHEFTAAKRAFHYATEGSLLYDDVVDAEQEDLIFAPTEGSSSLPSSSSFNSSTRRDIGAASLRTKLKMLGTARDALLLASREDPHNSMALFGLGLCYELAGDWDAAIAVYRHHVEVSPRSGHGYLRLSTLLRATGAVDEAVVALSIGMRLKPTQAGVMHRYALLREAQGETSQAVSAFRETLLYDPQNVDAHFQLGRLLLLHAPRDDGTAREAANVLERAVTIDGSKRTYREHLAAAYERLGKDGAALQQWETVCRQFPDDPVVVVAHGMSLEKVGKTSEAAVCFQKASAGTSSDGSQ